MRRVALLAPYDPRPLAHGRAWRKHGGVERVVWNLGLALARQGWDVSIIASGSDAQTERMPNLSLILRNRMIELRRVPIFAWERELLRGSFDVVHAQGTYPFLSDAAALFARSLGIPCVVSYQFDAIGRSPLERRLVDLYYASLGSLHRLYDRVIFSTQDYVKIARISARLEAERIRVVPNGVDPEIFCVNSAIPKEPQFLFVGRFAPYKGLDVLLSAFAQIANRIPSWHLVLVGDGELRDLVAKRVEEWGRRILWLPRVADEELVELYNAAAATVLPSTDSQEAFGVAAVESLACGTPVIVSGLPGLRELEQYGGRVVPPGDQRALADALLRATSDPRGDQDRERQASVVHQRFAWDEIARQTAAIYGELL